MGPYHRYHQNAENHWEVFWSTYFNEIENVEDTDKFLDTCPTKNYPRGYKKPKQAMILKQQYKIFQQRKIQYQTDTLLILQEFKELTLLL